MNKVVDLFKVERDIEGRNFGLDLIRAVAILTVVFAHGDILIRKFFPGAPFFWVIDGVDLFFVLSGFLIGTILIKIFDGPKYTAGVILNFWKRRWFRTLPNYYLILFVNVIIVLVATGGFGEFSLDYVVFLQNFRKPHPYFFEVAWSLAIEEWFYLLIPVALFALRNIFYKVEKRKLFMIAVLGFILLSTLYRMYRYKKAILFATALPSPDAWDLLFRKVVLARFDTIIMGVAGAFIKFYYPKAWRSFPGFFFIAGIVVIFITQKYFTSGILFYVFSFNMTALGILLLMPKLDSFTKFAHPIAGPVTHISIISYSIYLIHYTLLIFIITFFEPRDKTSALLMYAIYLSGSFLLSTITYKYFEKPALQLREKQMLYPVKRKSDKKS